MWSGRGRSGEAYIMSYTTFCPYRHGRWVVFRKLGPSGTKPPRLSDPFYPDPYVLSVSAGAAPTRDLYHPYTHGANVRAGSSPTRNPIRTYVHGANTSVDAPPTRHLCRLHARAASGSTRGKRQRWAAPQLRGASHNLHAREPPTRNASRSSQRGQPATKTVGSDP
jgi:hypothetical protein